MKFLFKRIHRLLVENRERLQVNDVKLEAAEREHQIALARDRIAEEQAHTLSGMDRRNHYSESLTLAFRGRTSQ